MKKYFYAICIFAITFNTTYSQLKISNNGSAALGLEPRSDFKLLMKGNLMLTTYPEIPAPLNNFVEFRFVVGNGWPGCEFGSTLGRVRAWTPLSGYNTLIAHAFKKDSQVKSKTNFTEINNGLKTIMQIQPYSYYPINLPDEKSSEIKQYGFFAQDIANLLPEIIDTAGIDTFAIDYDQIIPFLVAAIKEQQIMIERIKNNTESLNVDKSKQFYTNTIDSLFIEINRLKNKVESCCQFNYDKLFLKDELLITHSTLMQNRPNPFSEKSTIKFNIQQNFNSALIAIFDMQGTLKKTISINKKGEGEVIINGFELEPGMYLYSLIIDNTEIDTKRMILWK